MALSGLFERGCRTSAMGGKADIPHDGSLLKAKQLPLFIPVDRYLRCQSHQFLSGLPILPEGRVVTKPSQKLGR